mmetsp:Transcript_19693/g.67025  ORF Transcript_19693/g.67025 Transcript_19693/m.67025 type:complete len:137 (+) Transcript_19693:140-550(+)
MATLKVNALFSKVLPKKAEAKPAPKPAAKVGIALPISLPKFELPSAPAKATKKVAAKPAKATKKAAPAKKAAPVMGLYAKRQTEYKNSGSDAFDMGVKPTGFASFGFGLKERDEESMGPWWLPGYKGTAFTKGKKK